MNLQFDISFDARVKTTIALPKMIYIEETNLFELHPMDVRVFNDK